MPLTATTESFRVSKSKHSDGRPGERGLPGSKPLSSGEGESESARDPQWYCVRTKPKAEHLAAAHVRRLTLEEMDIEVFCPRIRFQKATARGKVWFVEALFPGYLFARFDLATEMRAVQAQPSVSGILHFGDMYPSIDARLLIELREEFGDEELRQIAARIQEGDEVEIVEGALKGLTVVISRLLPGKERVRILMEWLGEDREAEVSLNSVARRGNVRSGPMD